MYKVQTLLLPLSYFTSAISEFRKITKDSMLFAWVFFHFALSIKGFAVIDSIFIQFAVILRMENRITYSFLFECSDLSINQGFISEKRSKSVL